MRELCAEASDPIGGRTIVQADEQCLPGFRERNDCDLIELPYPDADGESANAIQT
jgi:hypothetical protein